jgi:hypothetical protein
MAALLTFITTLPDRLVSKIMVDALGDKNAPAEFVLALEPVLLAPLGDWFHMGPFQMPAMLLPFAIITLDRLDLEWRIRKQEETHIGSPS